MGNPAGGHTVKKFDEELSTLRDLVLRMGGLVEDQLRRAVAALQRGDTDAAKVVVSRDREIDAIELRADQEIAHLLAIRTPLGIDLRTVLTLSKTVTDLERIGDEAKKVARSTRRAADLLATPAELPFLPALTTLAQLAAEQLDGALQALARLDLEQADSVKSADDRVDDAFGAVIGAITGFIEQGTPQVRPTLELLFAAKALERIGDHAKNITQYVFYLVEGRDIRHPKSNPAMQAARD